jgi:phosphoglycerate kinase
MVAKGLNVGRSVKDDNLAGLKTLLKQKKIILPTDLVVENDKNIFVKSVDGLSGDDVIVDTGPNFVQGLIKEIGKAKFVLWNGPLGNFEKGFDRATKNLAKALAKTNAFTVVGGGDTVASIADLGLNNKFDFVSTGGGAMLDFLATGTLPGIVAIQKSKKNKAS